MAIRTVGLLCSGAVLLALSVASPAAPVTGSCKPIQVKFNASSLADSTTTSSAFVNLPEGQVAFTQGSAGCVLVRFSASTFGANGIDVVVIRAVLDNATAALPASIKVRGENDVTGYPRTFEFIFPSVAPGAHILRMQFASEKGNVIHVKAHNTVVQYVP
jgi:hypothetical protein